MKKIAAKVFGFISMVIGVMALSLLDSNVGIGTVVVMMVVGGLALLGGMALYEKN